MADRPTYVRAARRNARKTSFKVFVVFVRLQPKLKQINYMYNPQMYLKSAVLKLAILMAPTGMRRA